MTKLSISFFSGVTASLIKWALIAVLWLGSIVFVTTSALAMDAISDVMMRFAGVPTLHLDQKRKVARANTELQAQKNQTARAKNRLAEDRAIRKKAVLRHRKKVDGFVVKMVRRNVAAAGTAMLPAVGGAASVGFAVADVHAGCELIAMQNELEIMIGMPRQLSSTEEACVNGIKEIDELGRQADEKLAEMRQAGQHASDKLKDYLSYQMCRVTGDC